MGFRIITLHNSVGHATSHSVAMSVCEGGKEAEALFPVACA